MRQTRRVPLAGWVAPEVVVRAFAEHGDVVWFDAGVAADSRGATPLDGHPSRSLIGWGTRRVTASAREPGAVETALSALDRDLRGTADPAGFSDPLGWWGVVGYGVTAELLAPGDISWATALADGDHPDLAMLDVDRALVFDHSSGLVTAVIGGDHSEWLDAIADWWPVHLGETAPDPGRSPSTSATWRDTDEHYLGLIALAQAKIRVGDAFVLCLTTSVDVPLPPTVTDLTLYARLRRHSPAPRASFVRIGGLTLLGASPETFLTLDSAGIVSSSPIKGTRARSPDMAVDAAAALELADDDKERAENLMIVDLMRNDLSRISDPRDVAVAELFGVRSYRHVHQLVSTVTARARPGTGAVDLLRATFPPGSMTGAPKHSAVQILSSLEASPRGPYSGVVGRLGRDGTADLAVVIRSVVLDDSGRRASVGVGGGITAASRPEAELAEVRTKAAALLAALGVTPHPESLI